MKFFVTTILFVQILVQSAVAVSSFTVEQLRNMPGVTPEKFITLFSEFEFRFHAEVQDHNVFLSTRSGDCDDFATLAADVLTRNGYTTHLIAVRMKGETHVVCYVEESRCYLDYNDRRDNKKTVVSDGSLPILPGRSRTRSGEIGWQPTNFLTRKKQSGWSIRL